MGGLISRYGGMAMSAPAMKERMRPECPEADAFGEALAGGRADGVILLTGVGTRALMAVLEDVMPREEFAAALNQTRVIARGPKVTAVLRELGVRGYLRPESPFTWCQILELIDAHWPIRGMRVWVQEYGVSNPDFVEALGERGAHVSCVSVYRWELPEDLGPMRNAMRAIIAGDVDVALFTTGPQVVHLFELARSDGLESELGAAFEGVAVGSVGPMCSEALRQNGLAVDYEPSSPHMGVLVREMSGRARGIVGDKRKER